MNVIPGWFWLAMLLTTVVMMPAMVRRWQSLRGGRVSAAHGLLEALYLVVSRLWLPGAVVMVPLVFVLRLLFL